jgi:hypothetical protein
MAALLIGLSIMAVLMGAALPVWSHFAKREKEEELIWRGNQYARAIGLFQRKYANTFPPNVDILLEQRFLRKKYKDPITNEDFLFIPATGGGGIAPIGPPGRGPSAPGLGSQGGQASPGMMGRGQSSQIGQQPQPAGQSGLGSATFQPAMGIQGVTSKSKDQSIRIYNGRNRYNEWTFVYLATAQRIGVPGDGPQPGRGQDGIGGFPQGTDRRPGVGGAFDGRGGGRGQPPFGRGPFGPTPGQQQPFGQPSGQPGGPLQPGQQPPFGRPPFGQPPPRPPGN